MRRHNPLVASAIAAFAIAGAADAGAATPGVSSWLSSEPLQARSATPVVHAVQAARIGGCQPYPACDTYAFAWDFGAGTFTQTGTDTARTSRIEHTYGTVGIHPWAVRMTQAEDVLTRATGFATHDENWSPAPQAFTFNPDYQVTGRAFTVHISGRDDSPASGWTWGVDTDGDDDFDDAAVVAEDDAFAGGVKSEVTYAQDGVHTVRVRLLDGQGGSSAVSVTVRTHTANEPPQTLLTISGQLSPAKVAPGQVGLWDEGGFDDYTPSGELVHSWTLDGVALLETGGYVTRTFAAGEHHTVGMTVTDGGGLSSTATGEFDVLSAPPPPVPVNFAVADDPAAGTDGLRALQNIALYVNDPAGALPDSQLAWDLDGDGAYDDDHGRNTVVSYAAHGTYQVGLRAGDPAGSPVIVRRTLVVGQPGTSGGGAPSPTPPDQQQGSGSSAESTVHPVSPPPTATAPLAIVPFGRRLLWAGPVVMTDGVPPGTRPAAGRNAPGLILSRRTLILGRLFATRAARVQATATARVAGGTLAARTVTLGRITLTLRANTTRALRLRVPASVIRRVRRAKRLSVTTRLAVTEPGRKTVSTQRLARIAVVRR